MEVIPAIDLRDGHCVRLYQGDFDKETIYSRDPLEIARRWQKCGASRIHIVDLDGTKMGLPSNLEVIETLSEQITIPLQVGGGIRKLDTARKFLKMGIDRVMLGTAAVEDPNLIWQLCQEWGNERIVVAIDVRSKKISIRGWLKGTSVDMADLIERMTELGAKRFLYTDITRDGTLTEPDFDTAAHLVTQTSGHILVSGGISTLQHIRQLAQIGIDGAVVGSALYQGAFDLSDAIMVARTDPQKA